jgi:hypothetical protein
MFMISLGTTAVLVALAVRWCWARRWRQCAFALVGVFVFQAIASTLFGSRWRGYLYCTTDPQVEFLECPFKGRPYELMLAQYRESKTKVPLFRTFSQDWWNFYRWHDYRSHPRWKLPYRSLPQQNAEPARSSQQPPPLPLSLTVGDSLLPGFVEARLPGGCG